MAKTRGAARKLTANGAPKQGTVAQRKPAVQRQAEKAAKAKKAIKDPRTGKQKRVLNKLRREAYEAEAQAEQARIDEVQNAIYKHCPGLKDRVKNKKKLPEGKMRDDARFEVLESDWLASLAEIGITDEQLDKLLDDMFELDATKQLARDLVKEARAQAPPDDVDMDASPGEDGSSDEEAALAAQAEKVQDKGIKPYTKLLQDNNWKPPAHDDLDPETLDPARVLGTPVEGMENLDAARQAVNEHLRGPKITGLGPATKAELDKLAAFLLATCYDQEFNSRAKPVREGIGQVLGDLKRSKAANSPIDLTETPQRLRDAAQQLRVPHVDAATISSQICTTLDDVVERACEAMRSAESAGGAPATIDVASTGLVRGELLAHHKGKKSEQTINGFGMRLGQSRDKLAAVVNMAKSRNHHKLACDLLQVSAEVLPEFDNFMAVAERTSFEVAKSLYTSMGNPFAQLQMSKSHWDQLVALARNSKYREAIHSLGDLSPVPMVNVGGKRKRQRVPSSTSEDSSSDEGQRRHQRKRVKHNSPPGKKSTFCTFCKRKGHVKEDCRQRKKAAAKQQQE